MKLIPFFALREDILPVLQSVEAAVSVKYVLTGNFLKNELQGAMTEFTAGEQLLNLGRTHADSTVGCDNYLVCQQSTTVLMREVANGQRVCVDQLINPDTVTFAPAGRLDEKTVIRGNIGTASSSPASQALMKRFHAAVKKSFTKVRAFYVGAAAFELWNQGARLTDAVQSPLEFDLARPAE